MHDKIRSVYCATKIVHGWWTCAGFKSGRITLHYDVTTDTKEKRLFFRDICISKLRRTGMKTFTFKVNSVKTFESDTAGDLFSC